MACSIPPRDMAPLLEEGISTLPEYIFIAHGVKGVKGKRAQVKGPAWVCVLGGKSETCCHALPEVPTSGI